MFINEYFEKVFYINLDRRPDKNQIIQQELERHGITAERFSAVDGQTLQATDKLMPGEIGCALSHARILKTMVEHSWKNILILEDDAEFIPDLQEYFKNNAHNIPEWDMLYFGGNHLNEPVRINNAISRITRTYTTSHYAVNLNIAQGLINRIEQLNNQVDVAYSEFHSGTRTYAFTPAIAWQRACISDIHGVFVDYTSFMKPKGNDTV